MKSIYYREQKHICGKSYATAPYMEVDLYPVTPKQHKASRRAKRKEASTLAQQTYNDNRAKRYHVQLVNANFGKGDFSWTGTYDDDHHPEPGDTAKADRDLTNYIKRLSTTAKFTQALTPPPNPCLTRWRSTGKWTGTTPGTA